MSPAKIGFEIMKPYVGDSIPEDVLLNIIQETLSFDIPLKKIEENILLLINFNFNLIFLREKNFVNF